MLTRFGILVFTFLLVACSDEGSAIIPSPQDISSDAIGYYCGMIVINHNGPKAQIHLKGKAAPLWFVSVRDAIAFTLLPEEPKNIAAIYVTDMSVADWQHPETDMENWIDATQAFYVLESRKSGGMGNAEAVPFLEKQQAEQFVKLNKGKVFTLPEIPEHFILGNQEVHSPANS